MTSLRTRMSRQRILDGAWTLLDQGSLDELTVDAIARALHMSKSTLYKYFTSKEDVIVGIVEQACAATRKDVQVAAKQLDGRSIDVAVPAVLELYAQHAERLPAAILLRPGALPAASAQVMEQTWSALHEACRIAARASHELAAKALSTSARAAMVAAAAGEVDAKRGEAVRSLRTLFVTGLGAVAAA